MRTPFLLTPATRVTAFLAFFLLSCGRTNSTTHLPSPPVIAEKARTAEPDSAAQPTSVPVPSTTIPITTPSVGPSVPPLLVDFETVENFTCPVISTGDEQVVLVDDTGFDLSNEIFKDKVVGCYSLVCEKSPAVTKVTAHGTANLSGTFEDIKPKLIAYFMGGSNKCELKSGIQFKRSALFEKIGVDAPLWNESTFKLELDAKFDPSIKKSAQSVLKGDKNFIYHGTSTAGLIAYKNPKVKLVIVERFLDSKESASHAIACPKQAELDLDTRLLSDSEVTKAFAEQTSSESNEFNRIAKTHKVTIRNMSYGNFSRQELKTLLRNAGCPIVNIDPWFAAYGKLIQQREAYLKISGSFMETQVTQIQAAGNDSSLGNSNADLWQCPSPTANRLLVGASSSPSEIASFSNYGKCVSLYAPGDSVAVPAPQDFYVYGKGTSYSAPLVSRYVSMSFPRSASYVEVSRDLSSTGETLKALPLKDIPSELLPLSFRSASESTATAIHNGTGVFNMIANAETEAQEAVELLNLKIW